MAIAGEIYRDTVARHEDNPSNDDWSLRLLKDYMFLKPEKVKISGLDTPVGKAAGRAGYVRRRPG